jgi:hypothetical protein
MTHTERNAAVKMAIEAYSKKALSSKAAARRSLISSGIYTPSGDLKPEYGGPAQRTKAKG